MLRALLVDDEPDILLMLRVNLEQRGFETVLATEGESALRHIFEERFDVIVLDLVMPMLDGWAVLDRLRSEERVPVIVVISARSNPRDINRAYQLGAGAFLPKPFRIEALVDTIMSLVAMDPAERAARRARMIRIDPDEPTTKSDD